MSSKSFRRSSRFSLRMLLLLPGLVAALLACRALTQTRGEEDVLQYMELHDAIGGRGDPKYYLPFVLECSTLAWGPNAKTAITRRHYYLWLFGYVSELPSLARQHVDKVTPDRPFSKIADQRLLNRGF